MFSHVLDQFQGIATLFMGDPIIAYARLGLVVLGLLLFYLGVKQVLEPLLMIPMGMGMAAVNAAVLVLAPGKLGNIFVDPMVSDPTQLLDVLQIDFLQPIYTFTFSNGLIACLIFLGIGAITDLGYLLATPFTSMGIALFAEFGTVATYPIAVACGLTPGQAASIAMVGGADGPMVLYTTLILAKDMFVPVTIVAYLYLSLTYGGYPFLIKLLVPKRLRVVPMDLSKVPVVKPMQKLVFALSACTLLCFLFPVAAPLFLCFFLGVAVREAGIRQYVDFVAGPVLYGSTFFLGLMLGVLCEANTILNPKVLLLLVLGILSLLLSGIGGIVGGYFMYFVTGGKFNPVVGIAGVSCIPTTAKVAQKVINDDDPYVLVLPYAVGANISGVITTAILCGLYVTLLPLMK